MLISTTIMVPAADCSAIANNLGPFKSAFAAAVVAAWAVASSGDIPPTPVINPSDVQIVAITTACDGGTPVVHTFVTGGGGGGSPGRRRRIAQTGAEALAPRATRRTSEDYDDPAIHGSAASAPESFGTADPSSAALLAGIFDPATRQRRQRMVITLGGSTGTGGSWVKIDFNIIFPR